MDKYQKIFVDRLKTTLYQWKEISKVTNEDLYQYLHSIKGTAATIGLDELSSLAETQLEILDESLKVEWLQKEWMTFLHPIINQLVLSNKMNEHESDFFKIHEEEGTYPTSVILIILRTNHQCDIKDLLEQTDYEFKIVTTNEQAVTFLKDNRPDCIIVDEHWKDDLSDIIEMVNNDTRFIPFIMLGEPSSTMKVHAFKNGFMDYIEKPFSIEEMKALLDNRISLKKSYTKTSEITEEKTGKVFNNHHSVINGVIRVGIIDDDPVIQQLLLDYLSKIKINNLRLEIKVFREGETFMESDWHKQGGKYILLLDGIMPRMDGLEVLQQIRKMYREEDFIVIMLTARKRDQDVVSALNLGADDYLTKPFSLLEIDARIKRYVARFKIGGEQ